jgi:hypothetical protein
VLFFAISQLISVNNMYDFALPGFIGLFNTALGMFDLHTGLGVSYRRSFSKVFLTLPGAKTDR